MWFQHDGALAHFDHEVRGHLNGTFWQQMDWTWRLSSLPPHSPDLTPLDIFFWMFMKTMIPYRFFLATNQVPQQEASEDSRARKIFGAKRDEVTGEWRKLHNAELHALYSSSDIIRNIQSRRLRWAKHVARMGESRNAYRVLVGRPEGKRPLGRQRRRWEDNIKMDLREVGYDDRDWIYLAQDRNRWRAYVRAAMNLRARAQDDAISIICKETKIVSIEFLDKPQSKAAEWDEVKSEDSPKDYPAFAFWLGKTSEKPNQVIKSKGLIPRTRHRPSGFIPTAGENLGRNYSMTSKGDPTQARTQLRISIPASLPTELHRWLY
ncbi:hypothetical protein ANN_17553 [Periplaneta americana]|uniref:Uncharacterized protein n=1 Tax=Periplaneta americana TaxID=6978 RepID=A0ABQ8ST94_PERAM|nr:hypothetical protein ANN_17553 [Periplaneta americana]